MKRKKKTQKPIEPVETIIEEETSDPCQTLKDELRIIYDDRPVFIGREYNNLHKWYSRIEALLG